MYSQQEFESIHGPPNAGGWFANGSLGLIGLIGGGMGTCGDLGSKGDRGSGPRERLLQEGNVGLRATGGVPCACAWKPSPTSTDPRVRGVSFFAFASLTEVRE
jgi:hypothetical protein